MTVRSGVCVLEDRHDITLDAVARVAWAGEPVAIGEGALERMDDAAAAFESLVERRLRADPQALIYGVTSAPGDAAVAALDADGRARRPTRLWTATSYGDPLPERTS